MKQTFITIVLALAFAAGAAAQSTDTTAVPDSGRAPSPIINYTSIIATTKPTFTNPCIVRNIDVSKSLAVGKSGNSVYFYAIFHDDFPTAFVPTIPTPPSISTNMLEFSISSTNIFIEDMYIVDNYAFFCGYVIESSGQSAIYGYFDYSNLISSSLFTPPTTINWHKLTSSMTTIAPINLTDIVAYKQGSSYHAVAIGDETSDFYYCQTKIVEIFNAATSTPTFQVATVPNYVAPSYSGKVFLDDLVLTDNNVVVIGRDWNVTFHTGTSYPCFFIGNKSSVVSTICIGLNNYYIPIPWDANDSIAGVALDSNKFAMAYVFYNAPTQEYYTRLRVIDPGIVSNTHSQQFLKNNKENPVEMIYMNATNRIEILQPIANPADFIRLYPYRSTNYNTAMLNPDSKVYYSLSRIGAPNIGTAFVSVRPSGFYFENRPAVLPHSDPSCPTYINKAVKLIDNVDVLPVSYTIPSGSINSTHGYLNYPKTSYSFGIKCYSYE